MTKKDIVIFFSILLCIAVVLLGYRFLRPKTADSAKEQPHSIQTIQVPKPTDDTSSTHSESQVNTYLDTDKYYQETSTILKKWSARTSVYSFSEKEFIRECKRRGFVLNKNVHELNTHYDMEGRFNEIQIEKPNDEKHPDYYFVYRTPKGIMWSICVIEDQFIAVPLSFRMKSKYAKKFKTEYVLAEKNTILCYDGPSNTFYDVLPKTSSLLIGKIKSVNAKTLDKLSNKQIYQLLKHPSNK